MRKRYRVKINLPELHMLTRRKRRKKMLGYPTMVVSIQVQGRRDYLTTKNKRWEEQVGPQCEYLVTGSFPLNQKV